MKNCILLIYLLCFQAAIIAETTEELGIEEILSNYDKTYLSNYEKISYDVECKSSYKGAYTKAAEAEIYKMHIFRNGDRIDVKNGVERYYKTTDSERADYYKSRYIINSKNYMGYNMKNKTLPDFIVIDNRKEKFEEYSKRMVVEQGLGYLLDGIYPGSSFKSITDILKSSPDVDIKKKDQEIIDGHRTYVLEVETKYGLYTLWLDPEYGFNLRRMVIKKKIGDINGSVPLGTQPKPLPEGVLLHTPNKAKTNIEVVLDSVKIDKIDGVYIPVSAKVKERVDYENGTYVERVDAYTRTNIDFNPDFYAMGAFEMDVPNGTKVYFMEPARSGIRYEWQDGKIVTAIDQRTLDALDDEIDKIKSESQEQAKQASEKGVEVAEEGADEKPSMQGKAESQDESKSRTGSYNILGWGMGGLVIIVILGIGWFILRNFKRNKNEQS